MQGVRDLALNILKPFEVASVSHNTVGIFNIHTSCEKRVDLTSFNLENLDSMVLHIFVFDSFLLLTMERRSLPRIVQ